MCVRARARVCVCVFTRLRVVAPFTFVFFAVSFEPLMFIFKAQHPSMYTMLQYGSETAINIIMMMGS